MGAAKHRKGQLNSIGSTDASAFHLDVRKTPYLYMMVMMKLPIFPWAEKLES